MTPDPSDRRPPLVPPHVAWPAFIVFLLAISVTMAAVTVFAARSDGGARIMDTTEALGPVEAAVPADTVDVTDTVAVAP